MNKAKYQPNTFIITINKLPYDVKLKHSYWTDYNGLVKQMPDIINSHPAQSVIIVRCDTFDISINAIVEVLFTALVTDTDRNIVDNKQAFAPTPIQCNALLLHLSPAEGTSCYHVKPTSLPT